MLPTLTLQEKYIYGTGAAVIALLVYSHFDSTPDKVIIAVAITGALGECVRAVGDQVTSKATDDKPTTVQKFIAAAAFGMVAGVMVEGLLRPKLEPVIA